MKQWKQKLKYGAAVVVTTALPAIAHANAELSADAITGELTKSKPIIIAVAGAIFGLLGLIVAIAYAKRAAK